MLAEMAGEWDVDRMLDLMPATIFEEWRAYFRWKRGETFEDPGDKSRNFETIDVWNAYLKGLT